MFGLKGVKRLMKPATTRGFQVKPEASIAPRELVVPLNSEHFAMDSFTTP